MTGSPDLCAIANASYARSETNRQAMILPRIAIGMKLAYNQQANRSSRCNRTSLIQDKGPANQFQAANFFNGTCLNNLNRRIHRQWVNNSKNLPATRSSMISWLFILALSARVLAKHRPMTKSMKCWKSVAK
jgi:hypothetical protein